MPYLSRLHKVPFFLLAVSSTDFVLLSLSIDSNSRIGWLSAQVRNTTANLPLYNVSIVEKHPRYFHCMNVWWNAQYYPQNQTSQRYKKTDLRKLPAFQFPCMHCISKFIGASINWKSAFMKRPHSHNHQHTATIRLSVSSAHIF